MPAKTNAASNIVTMPDAAPCENLWLARAAKSVLA